MDNLRDDVNEMRCLTVMTILSPNMLIIVQSLPNYLKRRGMSIDHLSIVSHDIQRN